MKYIHKPIIDNLNCSKNGIQSALSPKKQSNAKLPIELKLDANTSAKLTEIAASMHISNNALISMAIERCLKEDVWLIGERTCVARNLALGKSS